ncbi:putative 12-oxophytodienoate reductase 11 [Senna tora]|uniref:Putative 12-oxophytodienoate reductase 11 n=1 Tax=Senna tora TaxID=362788 RepID=A0A834TRQ0_9FABA|nr:putative 12-oxophytodienoate reductase 11 [Senna tora]
MSSIGMVFNYCTKVKIQNLSLQEIGLLLRFLLSFFIASHCFKLQDTSSLECNNPFTNIDFMDSHTNMQSPSKSFGCSSYASKIRKKKAPFNLRLRNFGNQLDNSSQRLSCLHPGKHILQRHQLTSCNVNVIDSQISGQSLESSFAIASEGVNDINANIQSQSSLPSTSYTLEIQTKKPHFDLRLHNFGNQLHNSSQRLRFLQPGKHVLQNKQLTSSNVNVIDSQIPGQSLESSGAITSEGVNEINANIQSQSSLPGSSNISEIRTKKPHFDCRLHNSGDQLNNSSQRLRCLHLGKHILQNKQLTSSNMNVIDSQIPGQSLESCYFHKFTLSSTLFKSSKFYFIFISAGAITSEGVNEINANIQSQSSLPNYLDAGDPVYCCQHCGAMLWYDERIRRARKTTAPKFSICCSQEKVQLPRLQPPPEYLRMLVFDKELHE